MESSKGSIVHQSALHQVKIARPQVPDPQSSVVGFPGKSVNYCGTALGNWGKSRRKWKLEIVADCNAIAKQQALLKENLQAASPWQPQSAPGTPYTYFSINIQRVSSSGLLQASFPEENLREVQRLILGLQLYLLSFSSAIHSKFPHPQLPNLLGNFP